MGDDLVSDVAVLDAADDVQEKMLERVIELREKRQEEKRKMMSGDDVSDDENGFAAKKKEEDEIAQRDLSVASVNAVPKGLSMMKQSDDDDVVELIKRHEKHAKKTFKESEIERVSAQKRLNVIRERKNRERRVFDRAVEKGFSEHWVRKALEANPEELSAEEEDDDDDDDVNNDEEKKKKKEQRQTYAMKIKASQAKRFANVLDFLCLGVPRDDMPAAFAALLDAKSELRHSKIIPTPLHVNARNLSNVIDRSNDYSGETIIEDPAVRLL
ncbi:hypothetical protein, partial [Pseudomonas aeruginosa]|uniref:hypothetical protein n=1 Tax=Pseudomonas aeruginosa TaxID=287 RepID=UPI001F09D4A7